jgi:hypothetical protein
MDINTLTPIPSTSSTDLMKLIDDANRATTGPETEQWTVRGWPNGMAMFHKNNCRCCNDYVAHAICPCQEQHVDLHMQDVDDAVTTAWPKLMRDLESKASVSALADYKALADEAASLRAALKTSQSTLTSERSRIEQRDNTIHDLKDEIAALKDPQSTALTATVSTRPIAQLSCTSGPSPCLMALSPSRAQSGLTARMSQPGLASRIDAHPADSFNDPSGDFPDDVPAQDTSMPEGWEHAPNWDSDASIWAEMDGPGKTSKASGKKCKKRAHDNEHLLNSTLAVLETVMREYLARSPTRHWLWNYSQLAGPTLSSKQSWQGRWSYRPPSS